MIATEGLMGGSRFAAATVICFAAIVQLPGCTGGEGSVAPVMADIPTGITVTARDGNNVIGWTPAGGATSYNIYWATASGVTQSTGTKIALANNPQTHTGLSNGTTYHYVVTAVGQGGESAESQEVSAVPQPVSAAADPLYGDQWHLKNTGQSGAGSTGVAGEDINVEPAWAGYKGAGVRVAVVDDGIEIGHEDLASNIAPTGTSYNYVTGSSDPSYAATDTENGHGNLVAGIIAARDLNGLGVRGVAPRASLAGYNVMQDPTTLNEADAMTRHAADVHVSSNSWGPPDDGDLYASETSWRTAIDSGLSSGRDGRGTIYVWAAGNGGALSDNSNYDGMANYRGIIAVAAVNDQGKQASYSEPGANLWVSAPGGEYCDTHAITTTDRSGTEGYNPNLGYADYANKTYTKCMNGTSAATPAIAGVVALMLEANPNLGWRDVRLILAESSRKNDAADAGWLTTGGTKAYHFSHKYGFGVADAAAAVTLAQAWTNVGAQLTHTTALASPSQPRTIPDNNTTGKSSSINVTGSGITNIEYIEITFSAADHPYSGDLDITLTSPYGTVSQLAEQHFCPGTTCAPYNGWVFGSARHLGEAANGSWTLTVKDRYAGYMGTFQSWKLKFYGR